ncbi:MAG: HEAT repeat domain-containing protein, partial [Planktothrix sp.]
APREKTEKTIKILLDTLNDNDQSVRYRTAVSLNSILRKLDSDDLKKALTEVEKKGLTKSNDWRVRLGAAEALGSSGRDVKTAIIIFKELLEKNTDEITQE